MTKLRNPLFSLDAVRRLGNALTFRHSRGQNIVETSPDPPDAKSLAQLSWRHMYLKAVALWHALSPAEQHDWESQARRRHMTGFAWFMSQALKPNPGLYLPLQGGTMAGDIDMAKFRLLRLPAPTDAQEADTLTARNAAIAIHAALAAVHHARYTNGEADARIALHAAIAAAHHVRYSDAEAVAAAKTVKLDDFAVPDDNADLDFSTARHGLVPKGPDVGRFLKDDGTWAVVAVVGVPSGGIIIWHGTIANIPAGFIICDGNNGTPLLLTRFVQGVATAATDPGATGGANTHTHTVDIWAHAKTGTILSEGFVNRNRFIDDQSHHDWTGASTASHASRGKRETTGPGDSHPRFYDVAFIMKT